MFAMEELSAAEGEAAWTAVGGSGAALRFQPPPPALGDARGGTAAGSAALRGMITGSEEAAPILLPESFPPPGGFDSAGGRVAEFGEDSGGGTGNCFFLRDDESILGVGLVAALGGAGAGPDGVAMVKLRCGLYKTIEPRRESLKKHQRLG
jgi:hypothetical protein